MENMLWIEEIVESRPVPQFLANSRIDIAGFVNTHNVVVSGNAFLVVQVHQIQVIQRKTFFLKHEKRQEDQKLT